MRRFLRDHFDTVGAVSASPQWRECAVNTPTSQHTSNRGFTSEGGTCIKSAIITPLNTSNSDFTDGLHSGEKLSKATLYATLTQLKRFFQWLAWQPGYKSAFQYSDADYFNLSDKDTRIATARREQKAPTLDQVRHVIATMPTNTDIERRNRALIAFALLTGARDRAIASMKLKHVDLAANRITQDAREVNTKFSKTFITVFFPVGDEIRNIVADWVTFLREEELWGNDDPLFPATQVGVGPDHQFVASGLQRGHWNSASPIRAIFREAFERAGLQYFNPHSFRRTLVRLGQDVCKTPEHFKAWSQNLGHESVLTTFLSYGEVGCDRQGEIINGLATPQKASQSDANEIADALFRRFRDSGVSFSAQPAVDQETSITVSAESL